MPQEQRRSFKLSFVTRRFLFAGLTVSILVIAYGSLYALMRTNRFLCEYVRYRCSTPVESSIFLGPDIDKNGFAFILIVYRPLILAEEALLNRNKK